MVSVCGGVRHRSSLAASRSAGPLGGASLLPHATRRGRHGQLRSRVRDERRERRKLGIHRHRQRRCGWCRRRRQRRRLRERMTARRQPNPTLASITSALRAHYGRPAPLPVTDPFEMILWENVAYLVPDARRAQAFAALRERIGLEPRDILRAKASVLYEVAKLGGVRPEDRVEKLRAIAH